MTNAEPHEAGAKRLRNTLFLWGGLLLLVIAVSVLDRYTRGYTPMQILAEVPWPWMIAAAAVLFGLRWLTTRPLSPELEKEVGLAMMQLARERAVCPHCGQPREHQALTCKACGRVVDWAQITGAALFVFLLLGVISLRLLL